MVFHKIKERKIEFPRGIDNDTRDIIDRLLDLNPLRRIGMAGYSDFKRHPYFKGIDFDKLEKRKLPVPCLQVFDKKSKSMNDSEIIESSVNINTA